MTISKWLIAFMCAGSALAGSVVTVAVQSNSECMVSADQKKADAAFKAQPNIRGGSKGY
ncbi:hypothetical protein M0G61_002292 [Salmonella enterica]|nr:hypothetical protein [Salmonella enterica]